MEEPKQKKSFRRYVRALHRDIGFFVLGLTVIYCLSGIILIFRDTSFLKKETTIEKTLSPEMSAADLAGALRMKDFKVVEEKEDVIIFNKGAYDKQTGITKYTEKILPDLLNKFVNLHKSVSKKPSGIPTIIYGSLLLFLALSSFWMFNPKSKNFRRGIVIALVGIGIAISFVFLF